MFKQSTQLTVEVLRDVDFPDLPTDEAEAAIDFINERVGCVGALAISGLAKKIRIAKPGQDTIDAGKVRWPVMPADLNIILTERTLVSEQVGRHQNTINDAADLAIGGITVQKDPPLAVIKVKSDNLSVVSTIEHEIAHMLGLKVRGDKADGAGHCIDLNCMQYHKVTTSETAVDSPGVGIGGWLQRRGLIKCEQTLEKKVINTDFCDECVEQLGRNAFFRSKQKAGETIPVTLLW